MKKNPCLYLQVEESYGTLRLRGYVGYIAEDDGAMCNVSWRDRYGDDNVAPELGGFVIRAFVGSAFGLTPTEAERGVWGWGVEYDAGVIDDPRQALAIARTLTKVQAGLRKLEGEQGYLAADDFAGYVLRVARVLRIKDVYVRNARERLWNDGQLFRRVDGAALQMWVQTVDERARTKQQLVHTR